MLLLTAFVHRLDGDKEFTSCKVFPLDKTCCVSITGTYGADFWRERQGQRKALGRVFIPNQVDKICQELAATNQPIDIKICSVINRLYPIYLGLDALISQARGTNLDDNATRLVFMGYDPSKEVFFEKTCEFDGTNKPILETRFERHLSTSTPELSFQGEEGFFRALFSHRDERLRNLPSDECERTFTDLYAPNRIISDKRVILRFILSFALLSSKSSKTPYFVSWSG
jgi:hypothetical protein